MKEEFEKNGYYVLRGVLTESEVDRLVGPIHAAFSRGDYDTFEKGPAYPAPGIHSMGPRVLEENPDIAEVSLAHPIIMAAIRELPFIDYTETVGPLAISPGSHRKSTLLPSNGRVHQVDAAQVPEAHKVELIDPSLKKGDVVLMDGFLWHEARPNYGNSDRCGLYMKFHAKSSPPACGPTIFPSAVHDFLPDDAKHLVPYHRGDGRYAALRDGPVGGIDEARLLIEDSDEKVLVIGNDTDGWQLPKFAATEDPTAGILDVCNVMGSVVVEAREQLGLHIPWLSWLVDLAEQPDDDDIGEWRCRVYGHRLQTAALELDASGVAVDQHRWMSVDKLEEVHSADILDRGVEVLDWLRMWQNQEDEEGRSVTRSYGVPTTHVEFFKYNGNGNPEGTYRVGEFDQDGQPVAAGI
jgi:hypothetical protein